MEIICFLLLVTDQVEWEVVIFIFHHLMDGKWSEPVNLRAPVNTPSWESQPSISADGRSSVFFKQPTGGFGGKDIWYSSIE